MHIGEKLIIIQFAVKCFMRGKPSKMSGISGKGLQDTIFLDI
jgi:hypothetical protein